MGLLLQGGSGNIANIQFEGGDGNKSIIIPKEGGRLAIGANLSGVAPYNLLAGDLSVSNEVITNGFSTTLYTGSGSANTINTGIDMDTQHGNDASERFGGLVWLKSRSLVSNNAFFDTVRGATKYVVPNTTDTEITQVASVTSFNNNGFSLGTSFNTNLATYVSWNFQTTHRRTGTTNHGKTFTEHYNPFTGFTIIKYEGSGLAGHEIPHALGRKLGFVAVKNLSATVNWVVTNESNKFMYLNLTDAITSSIVAFGDVLNNVVTINTSASVNTSTNQYIMYGWANSYFDESNKLIGNYEIGTYQGTGAAGNKITTRDKPAWLLIKRLDAAADWVIIDNQRTTKYLLANSSQAEIDDVNDVLFSSLDFTINSTGTTWNASGGQYLYMVVYDNDSGSGKSKYPRATDTSNLQINNALIPFANGIDSNGTKNSIISKNESITGLTYTAGKNYVYTLENGTYGVKPFRPRYLRSDLVAERAGDNPDYFDVFSNKWFSTIASSELVTNGTFTDGTTTGWISTLGTSISNVSSTLRISALRATVGKTYTNVSLIPGKRYKLKLNYSQVNTNMLFYCWFENSSDVEQLRVLTGASSGTVDYEFIAQNGYDRLVTYVGGGASGDGLYSIDNVSIYPIDLVLDTEIPSRNYMNHIVYADANGQLTYEEELPKTQYFDRIETSENRKVIYLADRGISAIQVNKRYVLENPFGNENFMDCDTKLEIYDSGINDWISIGGITQSSSLYFGSNVYSIKEGIEITTASNNLARADTAYGNQSKPASGNLTSAPARVTIQYNGKTGRVK
jgi:hypothetical protein